MQDKPWLVWIPFLLLIVSVGVSAQQGTAPPPPLAQCQSLVRVKQDLVTYSEQLAASLLTRAEQAEQALTQAKQQQERTEEELSKVRGMWEALKTQQPSN
jgi:phage shock protein A